MKLNHQSAVSKLTTILLSTTIKKKLLKKKKNFYVLTPKMETGSTTHWMAKRLKTQISLELTRNHVESSMRLQPFEVFNKSPASVWKVSFAHHKENAFLNRQSPVPIFSVSLDSFAEIISVFLKNNKGAEETEIAAVDRYARIDDVLLKSSKFAEETEIVNKNRLV